MIVHLLKKLEQVPLGRISSDHQLPELMCYRGFAQTLEWTSLSSAQQCCRSAGIYVSKSLQIGATDGSIVSYAGDITSTFQCTLLLYQIWCRALTLIVLMWRIG